PKLEKKYLWQVIGAGLCGMALPWIFLFWAEKTVAPALASLINSTTTLYVVLLTPLFNPKDKITSSQWGGVLVGIVGIAIIFWPDISFTDPNKQLLSMLALLATTSLYAVANQWSRRFSHIVDNQNNAYYQMLASAVVMLMMSLLFDPAQILPTFDIKALMAVLYLGIFSTGIAILLNYWIIKNVGGVQSAAIVFLIPLVSITLDLVIIHKSLEPNQYVGGAVILLALVLLNKKGGSWIVDRGSKKRIA
ncbi:MAG TPA: DMT family transporter, partial [bacterium]|nr:DMT family transporter [bacterium]